jgi:two-component system, NtrC family, C4-dicarboxylate transport sensor histidine kinase DctB
VDTGDAPDPSGPPGRRWRLGPSGLAVAGAAVCLLLAVAARSLLYSTRVEAQRQSAAQRLEFFVTNLEYALEKSAPLPFLLGLERDVVDLLLHPDDPERVRRVNHFLETAQSSASVAATYLLDAHGLTLASSNWATPQSYIGQRYAFRPYFQEAMAGRPGRFYGVGATTGEPGYFLSFPLRQDDRILGALVVKVKLEELESAWERSGELLLVSDENGVVFLSSHPAWKYHTLAPIAPQAQERLLQARQYPTLARSPPAEHAAIPFESGARVVTLRLPKAGGSGPVEYLVQSRPAGPLGWHMLLLSDLREARSFALGGAAAVGFAAAFALTALVFVQQRRSRQRERHQARQALERVYRDLERRISERTADLVAANERLEEKVSALARTERILRETQDSAVQAGKLAVLGQTAAGITHELNQPLAALTTLQDNTVRLVELGRLDEARDNLRLMSQLTGKMGRILGMLKAFARKSPRASGPVAIAQVVADALALVDTRRRDLGVTVEMPPIDTSVQAVGDSVRIEQILVNLLRNGIEAMDGGADRRLEIAVEREVHAVRIAVRDHGGGIAAEARDHLFEPFFTTKAPGVGLGLGLAISRVIAQGLGGELTGGDAPGGGAEFVVTLVAA